ncbi:MULTISPECIES: Htur_1727 family rSAM-partnered candidate RiPP [Haloarcula]|uniref:Htur_1727 family rSAM-partnered candidate RiPP n=1 Tax=Haloarcula TaxID=2237 RepID=UPI0023E88841|nr:Htur_1727 family rSAM-partnered candidate RiPP [Halomicroarcula sp. SHR3]
METLETVDAPRGDTTREWEVFCRETESEPLTHVGSVSAPTAAVARDQAATLFGHATAALWLCPAEETVRVQERDLGVSETAAAEPDDGESAPTMDADRMTDETLRGEAE